MDADAKHIVCGWLDDLGMGYREGGVTGRTVDWSITLPFGSSIHVSVAHESDTPRRIEIVSDLGIAEPHRAMYQRLLKAEREAIDGRVLQALLRRSTLSFQIKRDATGAPGTISIRGQLPLEGLSPVVLLHCIQDVRNATMELCIVFQETLGAGDGVGVDRLVTDTSYSSVVLHRGTLETLGAFQIPGETLDETILRAVRE